MKKVYFPQHGGVATEQNLVQDLVDEQIKLFGSDVFYIPRVHLKDKTLGEVIQSEFNQSYMIEMFLVNVEGFGAGAEFVSKFGLRITDEITFVVSRRRWEQSANPALSLAVDGRPNEGDVIYYPLMNKFFEVAFVEDQEPFFQLGNLPVYKLRCKTFEYSSEEFNTGNPDIDMADDRKSLDTSLQYQFLLEDGTFSQTSSSGRLILETGDKHGNPMYLIQEEFDDTTTDGDPATSIQTKSVYADNLDLDTEAGFDTATVSDDILDFTEANPFGDVK